MKNFVKGLVLAATLFSGGQAMAGQVYAGSITYTGGSLYQSQSSDLNFTSLRLAQTFAVEVAGPCSIDSAAVLYDNRQGLLAPTQLVSTGTSMSGLPVSYFSVNGGRGAYLSGVRLSLNLVPFRTCVAKIWTVTSNGGAVAD